MAHLAGEAAVLAQLASAMVPDVAGLRTRLRQLPDLLRAHAVVAQDDDCAHLVLVEDLQRLLEARHEAVVVDQPDAEALELDDDAHRVESDLLADGELAVHLLEMLLRAERLPLVRAVRAARGHVVAAADPGLLLVPVPGLFLRPGARALREHHARRAERGHHQHQLLHVFHSFTFELLRFNGWRRLSKRLRFRSGPSGTRGPSGSGPASSDRASALRRASACPPPSRCARARASRSADPRL